MTLGDKLEVISALSFVKGYLQENHVKHVSEGLVNAGAARALQLIEQAQVIIRKEESRPESQNHEWEYIG